MEKRIAAVIFVALLLTLSGTIVYFRHQTKVQAEAEATVAVNAQDLYEDLLTNMPMSFFNAYPDTFCGSYSHVNQKNLIVMLTDCSPEVTAIYDEYFSNPDLVIYEEATYSYNTLLSIRGKIERNCKKIMMLGCSQMRNCVTVGTTDVEKMMADLEKLFGNTYTMEELPVEVSYNEGTTF